MLNAYWCTKTLTGERITFLFLLKYHFSADIIACFNGISSHVSYLGMLKVATARKFTTLTLAHDMSYHVWKVPNFRTTKTSVHAFVNHFSSLRAQKWANKISTRNFGVVLWYIYIQQLPTDVNNTMFFLNFMTSDHHYNLLTTWYFQISQTWLLKRRSNWWRRKKYTVVDHW